MGCSVYTYPIYLWTVALVEKRVENHDDGECWVIGDDCLGAAKLTLVYNIQPRAEDQDPGDAVKSCLEEQEHGTTCCQGTLLCAIPE